MQSQKRLFDWTARLHSAWLLALGLAVLWWSPLRAWAGLIDQWRAEDLNLNDGDAVGSWTSVSNRIVTGGAPQPVLKQNATPGGGAVVRFNHNFLTTADSPLGGATAFSIAIVFKASAPGANDAANWYGKSGLVDAEQPGVTVDWGTVIDEQGRVAIGSGQPDLTTFSSGPSLVDSNFHVAVFTWGGGSQSVYVDSRPAVTQSGVSALARMNAGFAIGGILTGEGGANRQFVGDLAEIQFYNTKLSSTEVSNVIADLTAVHLIGTLPVIRSFTASSNQILIGAPVTLSWVVKTNSDTIYLAPDIGLVTNFAGSVLVWPRTNTTYTLTASNASGLRSAQVMVLVDQGIPVANSQRVDVQENHSVTFTLTGSDPQGSNVIYAVATGPRHGLLSGPPPNLTYTPETDYQGSDQFTFTVNDGEFDSPPATVTIRVLPPPTAPSAVVLTTTNIDAGAGPGSFIASLRAIDVNPEDTHAFSLVSGFGDNALFVIEGNRLQAGPAFAGGVGSTFNLRIRATDNTGLGVDQDFVLTVREITRSIVINEIHYNPADNTVREEFIELHNPTTNDVDVSFWRIAGGVDYALAQGNIIRAGGFLVIAQDPPTILARYSVAALGPWAGALASEGERVSLLNANGQTVNEVNYRSEFPWPIGANGSGGSMALVNPSLDNDLGSSWRTETPPTPGATNRVFATNAPPNIRQVYHTPQSPAATNQVVLTAKVTDPDGVASVQLQYQLVTPGNYLSSIVPLTVAQLNVLNSTPMEPTNNPAFENPTNWITVPMLDDGTGADELAGDNIYTAVLPPQANRVLVRYRIVVADTFGLARRAPFEDDPSLNFAYFVYDGVPAYAGISSASLQTLPVYFLITRAQDFDTCSAYNGADQMPQFNGAVANEGRFAFNWEGAFVYDGEVYDHVRYRTQGANGRYYPGKRSFSLQYNDGRFFAAKDQNGQPYPKKWSRLNFAKGSSNRQTLTFSLNEVMSYFLWNKVGVPSPLTHYMHWRVVRGAQEQPDLYSGDFYGTFMVQENYDVRFLATHGLAKGNLYKLINAPRGVPAGGNADMLGQQRYQAPLAATNAADAVNIQVKLTGASTIHDTASLLAYVNYPKWNRYHAICETVRDYDFWPDANKNAAWYFEPAYGASNNFYGRMWTLPWDATDTWGPTWNAGQDLCYNGIFPVDPGYSGRDPAGGQNLELQKDYFNNLREIRDLLIQPDQINPLIDAYVAGLAAIIPADLTRWSNAPTAGAKYTSMSLPGPGLSGGLAGYAQDLKNFLFVGGTYGWWVDRQTISPGGWAAMRLDSRAADPANIPAKPTISYAGPTNYPVTDLIFVSSAFSDPQGAATFGAMQWRVAEITPTNTPVADPAHLKLEWDAVWDSGELLFFTNQMHVPAVSAIPGRVYRARVRHKDNDGHWSNWSAPVQFVPSPVDIISDLQKYLVLSEIMYHPPNQGTIDGDEFEFIELKNTGVTTLDLSGLSFTSGIKFTFANGITLAPGQFFVLARNATRLLSEYPGLVINGSYTGKLNNAGDTLTLAHPYGTNIFSVTYSDRGPWPVTADGFGFSLVWDPTSPTGYRASSQLGGSPGADDPPSVLPRVLINEILSSAVPPALDAIELYNPTTSDADLGGWFLTDNAGYPWKYRIADGTILPAGCYLVFNETNFNPTPGIGTSFSLSSLGEEVCLFSGNAAHELTGYTHGFAFGGAARGETFGRYLNSVGEEQFPPQLVPTLGTNNAGPRVGPVVINKIHYHPNPGVDPFVELLNLTTNAVPCFDPANPTNTWKFTGLAYTFPTNISLAPNSLLLLVATNPAGFRAKYGVPAEVQILGPYPGVLQHGGERLDLQSPDLPTTNGVPYFTVDTVRFHDQPPWPILADGFGAALIRKTPAAYGDDLTNWFAASPLPGFHYQNGVPPVIVTPPQDHVGVTYSNTVLSVVAGGSAPFSYQWRFNGTNLPGATAAALTLTNALPSQAGTYSVFVFNAFGAVLSDPATLTLRMPVIITQNPQSIYVRIKPDSLAAPTTNVTFAVVAASLAPMRYQWRFNGLDLPNATNTTLTVFNVQASHWGEYTVRVADDVSATLSTLAWLYPLVKPTFTQNPLSQSVVVGGWVTMSAEFTGWPPPFTNEWRLSSTPLVTSVSSNFTSFFTFKAPSTVTNQSYRAVLKNVATAGTAGIASPFATLTTLADSDGDGIPDVWEAAYGFNPTNSLDRTLDSDGDGMLNWQEYVAGTDPTNPASYLRLDLRDTSSPPQLSFMAMSNHTYLVEFEESPGRGRWYRLTNISARADNRVVTFTDPLPMGGQRNYRVGTPWQPETYAGPVILAAPQSASVSVGERALFSVVALATGPLSYQWNFNDAPIVGAITPTLELTNVAVSAAGRYTVRLTDTQGADTSEPVGLTVTPLIVEQPQDQSVSVSQSATFRVVAVGAAPLQYRWYRDARFLPGQTNAALVLPAVQASDEASYAVVVLHQTPAGVASIRSRSAVLRVTP